MVGGCHGWSVVAMGGRYGCLGVAMSDWWSLWVVGGHYEWLLVAMSG